jgi:hypothetical protein
MSSETLYCNVPQGDCLFAPVDGTLIKSSAESSTDAANADATAKPAAGSFVGTNAYAMKLRNFRQSPKRWVEALKRKYVPTVTDYLNFLVNS